MSDEVKISLVLKHLMKSKKLTFKKLSQLSSVPESTIKTWSAGVEPKSLSHARKVARALDVSVEYLVFGESSVEAPSISELLTTQLFSGWCKVTIEMPVTSPIAKKKDSL
jgi:transcriptional regulator with XRE-family HTH domain